MSNRERLEIDIVYIDTRVYCRNVINVDHGDWFKNTLEEYKVVLEKRFGSIRFQNGSKYRENGSFNRRVIVAVLLYLYG